MHTPLTPWPLAGLLLVLLGAVPASAQDRWLPRPAILGRYDSATVWDSVRSRVVLFGGNRPPAARDDTWEWDGHHWTERTPTTRPPGRLAHAMAFDAARGETVLFGGNVFGPAQDTWVWDGADWQPRVPAVLPPARTYHRMAYDPVRQRVVLFGGFNFSSAFSDTWEWDGSIWQQRQPTTIPPARSSHAMAWDPVGQRLLMFGGHDANDVGLTDTWAWDGTDWTLLAPASAPRVGYESHMSTDQTRGLIVGRFRPLNAPVETWEWDGATWRAVAPSFRERETRYWTVYDGNLGGVLSGFVRDKTVTWLFDGTAWRQVGEVPMPAGPKFATDTRRGVVVRYDVVFGSPTSTFEWDGIGWRPRSPRTSPPRSLYACPLSYDAGRGRTVLFGGWDSTLRTPMNAVWEWDGNDWSQHTPTLAPAPRIEAALAYDPVAGTMLIFGGRDASWTELADTWSWDGTSWTRLLPATSPSPRFEARLAYDELRDRMVLFGSRDLETWEWDRSTWVRVPTATTPDMARGGLSWDPSRQRIVYAGANSRTPGRGWAYDGFNWTLLAGAGPSLITSIAYDPRTEQLLTVVGQDPTTWLLGRGAAAQAQPYGTGCGGSGGAPALVAAGLPTIANLAFRMEIIDAPPSSVGSLLISPNAAAIPRGGCTVWIGAGAMALPGFTTSSSGFAAVPLPVPPLAALAGIDLSGQALVLDASAPNGAALTEGMQLRLGH